MGVRVENLCRSAVKFDVEATVRGLLQKVPEEHLVGLEVIRIVDQGSDNRRPGARGLYWQKQGRKQASIELALNRIFAGAPRIVFALPPVRDFSIANVLFHEIGHHYQRTQTHGIGASGKEDFAERYKKKMLKQTFFWWLTVFRPVIRLGAWMTQRS